jgi:hypothetical protein
MSPNFDTLETTYDAEATKRTAKARISFILVELLCERKVDKNCCSPPRPGPLLYVPQGQGCQIFLGATYQNMKNVPDKHKLHRITITYTKWPQHIPNGRKIDQTAIKYINVSHCKSLWYLNTQIGIFGLKICHLATLLPTEPTNVSLQKQQ